MKAFALGRKEALPDGRVHTTASFQPAVTVVRQQQHIRQHAKGAAHAAPPSHMHSTFVTTAKPSVVPHMLHNTAALAPAQPFSQVQELQHVWEKDVDVDTLAAQLQDAQAERDMLEAQLIESEADGQRLLRYLAVLKQRQHQARDLLQRLHATLSDARRAADEEHLYLMSEGLALCGRQPCGPVLMQLRHKEERGIERLQVYDQSITSLADALSQVVTRKSASKQL